jgi:hypothetical protein
MRSVRLWLHHQPRNTDYMHRIRQPRTCLPQAVRQSGQLTGGQFLRAARNSLRLVTLLGGLCDHTVPAILLEMPMFVSIVQVTQRSSRLSSRRMGHHCSVIACGAGLSHALHSNIMHIGTAGTCHRRALGPTGHRPPSAWPQPWPEPLAGAGGPDAHCPSRHAPVAPDARPRRLPGGRPVRLAASHLRRTDVHQHEPESDVLQQVHWVRVVGLMLLLLCLADWRFADLTGTGPGRVVITGICQLVSLFHVHVHAGSCGCPVSTISLPATGTSKSRATMTPAPTLVTASKSMAMS